VRAPQTGRDLARHRFAPCRAHGAAGASSQPEPRGQVLQLDFPSPWPWRERTSSPRGSGSGAARGLVVGGGVDWCVSASIAPPGTRIPHTSRMFPLRQRSIPHVSRVRLPEVPGRARQSPQVKLRKILPMQEIPAHSRSARNHQDRLVTPEVAGSSPVAPAKVPANRSLLSPPLAQSTVGFFASRADPARESA
jgi:hypothetical protein